MRIIISGASGLVGSELVPSLEEAGHEITRLVRSRNVSTSNEAFWDPSKNSLDPAVISNADAVINLNGRNIAEGRWTDNLKSNLRSSRLNATQTIAQSIRESDSPPRVLINASAVGYYGDRGDEPLDETSGSGSDFLAELCRDWETAALTASSPKTRVVLLRLGMVVANGGALGRMLTPFKLGVGGPIGSGRQYWPWIAIADVLGIVNFILENENIIGPVNLVSPQQLRCSEFARILGKALHRPAFMPTPKFAARLALGEMADALLLASAAVHPKALQRSDYKFRVPDLSEAIRCALEQ